MAAPFIDFSVLKEMTMREGDVFISTGAKQGTTWTSYIVHQLLSHGDDDFKIFLDVVPWVEFVQYPGQPMQERLQSLADMPHDKRRAFRTHAAPPVLPLDPQVKYVICVRNPLDALTSMFHFANAITDEIRALWNFPNHISNWADYTQIAPHHDHYWPFINGWWPHRFDKNVFMFHYADLKNQPVQTIKKMAEFLLVDSSDDFVQLVATRSSFGNMKKNEERFETIFGGKNKDIRVIAHGGMMRKGEIAHGKEAPAELVEIYSKTCQSSCLDKEQLEWCMHGGQVPQM